MPKSEDVNSATHSSLSLEDLALGARSGSNDDFDRLAKHFTPALVSMVSALDVSENEVEDLLQEGLIGLYKAVRLYDPALSSFATFSRLCMRSALLDGVKKYRKNGISIDIEDFEEQFPASPSQGPERILVGKEELQELMEKVDRALSPMERRIFGLSLQGKKAKDIAEILGKETKSVENALYRLRKKLSASI